MLPVEITKSEVNVTAYATREGDGPLWITVLNKDLNREAELNIELPTGYGTTEAFPLRAPAVISREAPDFAGGKITSEGHWNPGESTKLKVLDGAGHWQLSPASVVLVRLRR